MPFPGEHAAQQNSPQKYKKFRRQADRLGPGINVIFGVTEDDSVEIQSIRFDKKRYTPVQARKWLKDHDFKGSLEPASEKKPEAAGVGRSMDMEEMEGTDRPYVELALAITKASVTEDGELRWQAVASDTGEDRAGEQTSVSLFQDWIRRVEQSVKTSYLSSPRMPFLGLSHYPSLEGFGEGGGTRRMYIDGERFKAGGMFYKDTTNHPLGFAIFNAVRAERALIKRGEQVENPIRISAAWWDIEHAHGDFTFRRRALSDVCPICQAGGGEKTYLKGQLDHFAATRVPINPRTSLTLEEKSMTGKKTRKEDALEVIGAEGSDLVEELDLRAQMVGKSEADDDAIDTGALVIRADDEESTMGQRIRKRRKDMEMTLDQLASQTSASRSTLGRIERDEASANDDLLTELSSALEMELKAGKGKKKPPPFMDDADDEEDTMAEEMADEDDHKGKRGKKRGMSSQKSDTVVERDDAGDQSEFRPLGGATTIVDAENYMQQQEVGQKLRSNWAVLRMVVDNILTDSMIVDKVRAMSSALEMTNDRIEALKAGLEDAYLVQMSGSDEYETDEVIDDYEVRGETMPTNQQQQLDTPYEEISAAEEAHPVDALKAQFDQVLQNRKMSKAEKAAALQAGIQQLVEATNEALEQEPGDQSAAIAEAVKAGVSAALSPLAEQIGLLTAKMNVGAPAGQPEQPAAAPVQKSVQMQGPVVNNGEPTVQGGHHVSPVIGKPSALTDYIRRSVGAVS